VLSPAGVHCMTATLNFVKMCSGLENILCVFVCCYFPEFYKMNALTGSEYAEFMVPEMSTSRYLTATGILV